MNVTAERSRPAGQTFKSSVNLIKSNKFKMDAGDELWTNEMLKPLRSFLFSLHMSLKSLRSQDLAKGFTGIEQLYRVSTDVLC